MKVLIVIPACNEQAKIYKVARAVKSSGYDVLVVDDGSVDFTFEEAVLAGARVLRHPLNRGYGAALETGRAWALARAYDIVVHFDADGQHDPGDLSALLAPIKAGEAEIVLGSRFLDRSEWIPWSRKILIKTAIIFTWIFSGVKLTDAHNGLRAFSRRALQKISCRQDGMSYASEIIDQVAEHEIAWREAPVNVSYSAYSRSKGENNLQKILLGLKFLWGKFVRK